MNDNKYDDYSNDNYEPYDPQQWYFSDHYNR